MSDWDADDNHGPSESGRYCLCGRFWPCRALTLINDLTAAQATIAQRDAQVAALTTDRDRLRARTHELQERHDAETRGMKKQVARYRDLFSRAGDALKQSRDGYVVIPSAWDSAMFGVLTEQLAARDAQVAELTAALAWSRSMIEYTRAILHQVSTGEHGDVEGLSFEVAIGDACDNIDTYEWPALLARTPAATEGETVRADG